MDRRTFLKSWAAAAHPHTLEQGAERLALSIAGVRFDLLTADARLARLMGNYFAEYRGEGEARLAVHLFPLTRTDLPKLWDDADPDFHGDGDFVVQRDFGARRERLADGRTRVLAALHPEEPEDAVHNLLRWVMPGFLLEHRCFLMHSASVVFRDEGYLFYGQSGAGKSTTVALIAGHEEGASVLGDDAGIIECRDGRAWLHSAPLGSGFSRLAPRKTRVPLRGIFSLEQSSLTEKQPMPTAEAVRTLLASAMTPDFSVDVDGRFDLAVEFAGSSCGVRRLKFQKSAEFWTMISTTEKGVGGV